MSLFKKRRAELHTDPLAARYYAPTRDVATRDIYLARLLDDPRLHAYLSCAKKDSGGIDPTSDYTVDRNSGALPDIIMGMTTYFDLATPATAESIQRYATEDYIAIGILILSRLHYTNLEFPSPGDQELDYHTYATGHASHAYVLTPYEVTRLRAALSVGGGVPAERSLAARLLDLHKTHTTLFLPIHHSTANHWSLLHLEQAMGGGWHAYHYDSLSFGGLPESHAMLPAALTGVDNLPVSEVTVATQRNTVSCGLHVLSAIAQLLPMNRYRLSPVLRVGESRRMTTARAERVYAFLIIILAQCLGILANEEYVKALRVLGHDDGGTPRLPDNYKTRLAGILSYPSRTSLALATSARGYGRRYLREGDRANSSDEMSIVRIVDLT